MRALLEVKAPSLKTGSEKRFVVAIGTTRPLSFRARLKSFLICDAWDSEASMGIRSLSWKLTPYAPTGEFEYRPVLPRLREKVRRSLEEPLPECFVEGATFHQDSTAWWPAEINDVDALITSPPFFDSTRFHVQNWLRLWFTGWAPDFFRTRPRRFVDERQKDGFAVYESVLRQARERIRADGVVVWHLGKSTKCDMASELARVGKQWFARAEIFDESVAHCESHGLRDKGTVTAHQYLILY